MFSLRPMYFDIIPDDVLRLIILKMGSEQDLIQLISFTSMSKIIGSKYFWDLKCSKEFPGVVMNKLLTNFDNVEHMSVFNLLHNYITLVHAYRKTIIDMKLINEDGEYSIEFSDVFDIDLLCLDDEDNIKILTHLVGYSLTYFYIFIGKSADGYYYNFDHEFVINDIDKNYVTTLIMNKHIKTGR